MFLRISLRKLKSTPKCPDFKSEILKNTLSNKLDKLFNTRETSLATTSCLLTKLARVPVLRRKRQGGLTDLKQGGLTGLRQVFILLLRSYSSMRSRYKISACIVQGDLKNVPTFKLH